LIVVDGSVALVVAVKSWATGGWSGGGGGSLVQNCGSGE
jgi:hypothetical protein